MSDFCDRLVEARLPGLVTLDEATRRSLDERVAAACEAWSDLRIPREDFHAHCIRLAAAVEDPIGFLQTFQASDVYLACAAAHAVPEAIRCIHTMLDGDVLRMAHRHPGVSRDDVRQNVEARLLVGPEPKIVGYTGRGSLRAWLRVVVARGFADLQRASPREVGADDDFLADHLIKSTTPELEVLRETYLDAYRRAFTSAVASLATDERLLLRMSLVDEVGIDGLATFFEIHRSTAARRLHAARDRLAAELRTRLEKQLEVAADELDSILRLIRSRIDVTLSRCFGPHESAPD